MRLGTVPQLSLGLAALACALLLGADQLTGLLPDRVAVLKETRQETSENLAVLLTALVQERQDAALKRTLQAAVKRNRDLLSVAVRRADGELIATTADHERYWVPPQSNRSTLTHVVVPIYDGAARWGQVEVNYRPISAASFKDWIGYPTVQVTLLMFTLGTGVFYFYLRRTLQRLNPGAAVPDRVRSALDVLSEAVLVIDRNGRVVLANEAFRRLHGDESADLTGKPLEDLGWLMHATGEDPAKQPWATAMRERRALIGQPLVVDVQPKQTVYLSLNCMPVMDDVAQVQGCFLTFDDQTRTERMNRVLLDTVAELEKARTKIAGHNAELKRLADYDSLTDCLTRRSFFEQIYGRLPDLRERSALLSCLMVDIDHFKSINDQYGHMVGDEVIRQVARVLKAGVRSDGLVCRYGGEEFCILLLGSNADVASQVGERLRLVIRDQCGPAAVPTGQLRVTISLGLASVPAGDKSVEDLISSADAALYAAKGAGRNRLMREEDRLAA
jgi:diguanylate cyclase (GGDEF)-like protein/PAS domain S-box-containing protein